MSELRDILFDPPSLLDLERAGALSWVLSWFWPKNTTYGQKVDTRGYTAIHELLTNSIMQTNVLVMGINPRGHMTLPSWQKYYLFLQYFTLNTTMSFQQC